MVSLADPQLHAMSSEHEAADEETICGSTKELLQVFDTFDEDGDGRISREELKGSLGKLGFNLTEAELVAMMATVDANGNGFIESEEFLSLHKGFADECAGSGAGAAGEAKKDEDLMEAFRVFDKNADGFISAHELQTIFSGLGLAEGAKLADCRTMIQAVDLDGDGQVSFSEFKTMMENKGCGK